jgi:hypothetical protein
MSNLELLSENEFDLSHFRSFTYANNDTVTVSTAYLRNTDLQPMVQISYLRK